MKRKITLLFFTILLSFSSLFSQTMPEGVLQNFIFSKDSMVKELVINVNEGLSYFEIDVKAKIELGVMGVKIFSSSGKLVSDFVLDANNVKSDRELSRSVTIKGCIPVKEKDGLFRNKNKRSKDNTAVNGAITQTENNPKEGNWVIQMIPEHAEGEVKISYSLK